MAHFEGDKVMEPRAQDLLQKVKFVHPETDEEGDPLPTEIVTVTLINGKKLSHEVQIPKGNPENPLTKEELVNKYRDCASLILPSDAVERSLELIFHLEEKTDITELAELVT